MQTVLISILASAITTKILAAYYFKKIDGYVEEMCKTTLKSNKKSSSYSTQTWRKFRPKGVICPEYLRISTFFGGEASCAPMEKPRYKFVFL